MREFIAIDFETANPKRVSACALGFVRASNGQIVEKSGFLIRPVGGHAPFQTRIHGITEEQTTGQPEFCDLFPRVRGIFEYPLVGHSLFDKQVLNALSEHFSLPIDFAYTDSSAVAKEMLPQLKNHKLKTLAKYFGIPKFKHHDATEDAVACATIFLKLQDLRETASASASVQGVREFQRLADRILSDNEVEYKEAYELLYWLEDNPAFASDHSQLWHTAREVLEDDRLDDIEASKLKAVLHETRASLH